ncbi:hypothetical protein GC101_10685 [Paenibacillus sp. LMG 31459]|uniref:Uncharacterized protein n=1 Tax=Paenibacillus phytohabitans TaxID=2654978 RepID=A0ABX1YED3_9BACL|nr:hypothetical protein [Paenibacillus phytohabitans]NOU79345.1 hypothetical protein [Paenibacillus phytohabitans]
MKFKILIISILTMAILVVAGNYRWEYRESDEVFSYKYDRWAKQLWAEFTPEIGSNDIIDIPLVYGDKLTTKELEPYLMKMGVSGEIVKLWVHRTRLSDAYTGVLIANIAMIVLISLNIIIRKKR